MNTFLLNLINIDFKMSDEQILAVMIVCQTILVGNKYHFLRNWTNFCV